MSNAPKLAPNVVFLHNELMNPDFQRDLQIPLHFLSFGFVKGQLYQSERNESTFLCVPEQKRKWGNSVVYGAVFVVEEPDFYWETLDAYHLCSMSSLLHNHEKDQHHRVQTPFIPISFASLDDLARLLYWERNPVLVQAYVGNLNQPNLQQRVSYVNSHRIQDGMNAKHFRRLYWEVQHATSKPALHGGS